MLRARRANKIFPGQLAHAVGADRPRTITFHVRRAPLGIDSKDIIRAEVDEETVEIATDFGQVSDSPRIDGEGGVRLAFRTVHEIISGTIEDHPGTQSGQIGPHCPGLG